MSPKVTEERVDLPATLGTVRASVCLVFQDMAPSDPWPEGSEEFVRTLCRHGLDVVVVGPRAGQKLAPKASLKIFDRHSVVSLKRLARAKDRTLELRLLGRKLKAWTRVRTGLCVVSGTGGVWPRPFPGWSSQGVLTIDALSRFVNEFRFVPGRRFLFLGSSNRMVTWASSLLDRGAEACIVAERGEDTHCWRAHRDAFLARGGRVLVGHEISRVQGRVGGMSQAFLQNREGTMLLETDVIVMEPINEVSLSGAAAAQEGLYYIQRRYGHDDPVIDEAAVFASLDWQELYWRIARRLELADHGRCAGALERIRDERRELREYRRDRKQIEYQGKNLSRATQAFMKSTSSVPPEFRSAKPVASLECLEKLPCRACVDACPHGAIEKIQLAEFPKLNVDACTGCGACVAICPAEAAVMVKDSPEPHRARYFLPDKSRDLWRGGEPVQILNRRGESLGTGRVIGATAYQNGLQRVLEIESPAYNVWDGRAFRKPPAPAQEDKPGAVNPLSLHRGWITLNGVRRLVPVDVPVTVTLWSLGQRRFEDAFFCKDGGCRLCAVTVNGKAELACRRTLRDWDAVVYSTNGCATAVECFCKQVSRSDVNQLCGEGVGRALAEEITGFASGACRGRWCVNRGNRDGDAAQDLKLSPLWPGFLLSPWMEIWPEDLFSEK